MTLQRNHGHHSYSPSYLISGVTQAEIMSSYAAEVFLANAKCSLAVDQLLASCFAFLCK